MRNIFIKNLIKFARQDKDMYILTADLGFNALEPFKDEFPDRFINVGVAEANMIGIATGLAMMGKKVCVYSIVPFVTLRCFEQIRNDVCWHNFNINLIGVGGGFSYGNQGISHNTTEDIAIMRSLPNMSIFSPGDKIEAEAMANIALNHNGPTYSRLGRAGNKQIYTNDPVFKIGKGAVVKEGNDLTIISTGNIIETVIEVAESLEKLGHSVRIISMPCIKPLDKDIILRSAKETKAVFVIEEHSVIGGLGSAAAETILESNYSNIDFKRIGIADEFPDKIGSHQFLRDNYGLSVKDITTTILKYLRSK
jgi:transketolase